MQKKEVIQEYQRDSKKDYLFILKALNEIPFPVGKILLTDFLSGDYSNKSILKNNLYEKHNFGSLSFLEKSQISSLLEDLISKKFIDYTITNSNQFMKTLALNFKGHQELIKPSLINNKNKDYSYDKVEFSEKDLILLKEFDFFLKEFNDEQKKSIIHSHKNILCIAGAGTGKTTVLTKRIEFLAKYQGVNPEKICAITFTVRAKNEMISRLKVSGVSTQVETFNSFCEKILKKNEMQVYNRPTRVAGFSDKILAVFHSCQELGLSLNEAVEEYFTANQKKTKNKKQLQTIFISDIFTLLDYYKSIGLEEFKKSLEIPILPFSKKIAQIVILLDKYLEVQGLRTFSDQIRQAFSLFEKDSKKIPFFDHLLVDEFQDVNNEQVNLIKKLNPQNLFCVGDPRQSIFGWRGSDINYIQNFEKYFPDPFKIHLKKNYRSNAHIVNFINHSIKDMNLPDLESEKNGDKFIKLFSFESEEAELKFIAQAISSQNLPLDKIFVLSRTNKQLEDLSLILKQNNLPFVIRTEEDNSPLTKDKITLSTIHSIKGLEAEMVFIIGCNFINFPCKNSDHPIFEQVKMFEFNKEEEEKRLFYVAISRAKNKLILTHTKKPTYFINSDMLKIIE